MNLLRPIKPTKLITKQYGSTAQIFETLTQQKFQPADYECSGTVFNNWITVRLAKSRDVASALWRKSRNVPTQHTQVAPEKSATRMIRDRYLTWTETTWRKIQDWKPSRNDVNDENFQNYNYQNTKRSVLKLQLPCRYLGNFTTTRHSRLD